MKSILQYIIILLIASLDFTDFSDTPTIIMEICDNAVDDDNDGLIDLQDPDCQCDIVDLESIVPNPSFESYSCCPDDHSQMRCVDNWIQPSFGTSDYVNHCGYLSPALQNSPLDQFPDGDGAALFLTGIDPDGSIHLEYIGTCLNRPLIANSVYTMKFFIGFISPLASPPIRITIYGSPSCDNLPFSESTADCPINHPGWWPISSQIVSSDGASSIWVEVITTIQSPREINAIVVGADCNRGLDGESGHYLDYFLLNDESSFDFELIEDIHPCNPNFAFAVKDNVDFSYQWYKEKIALIGETSNRLSQMYGEGYYQLRIINKLTQECRISSDYEFARPVIESEEFVTICAGQDLSYAGDTIKEIGAYQYNFTSVNGCDSIVMLRVDAEPPSIDSVNVQILPGSVYSLGDEQYTDEGQYILETVSANGCNNTLVLNINHIEIYTPNAFTPNGDAINDYFELFPSSDAFLTSELSIFDKWGNLLYTGNKWDGTTDGIPAEPGVYVFKATLTDWNGHVLIYSNELTLLR